MKRIYIFEGCDRTGKSTFIKYFSEKLKEDGKIPFIFHLMGPTKFNGLIFDNDEKSLIQLAKFNDEYDFIKEMLYSDSRIVIILDRSSFGEYVWSKFWNRTGKYTNYVTSDEFIKRHQYLMEQTLYIDYYMSNIDDLKKRIEESDEDRRIFTENGNDVKANIEYVYSLFEHLANDVIKKNDIAYMKLDSSNFKTFDDVKNYINTKFLK